MHIKTIGLMCAIKPSLIDTNKAASLLTYLQPASNVSHWSQRIAHRCRPITKPSTMPC